MSVAGPNDGGVVLTRVPAGNVATFIEAREKEAKAASKAEEHFEGHRAELDAARLELTDLLREFEARVEMEAEETAERTAKKVHEKTQANAVTKVLTQASEIASDYRNLEGWLVELVMAGVSAVLDALEPEDRWSRVISRAILDLGDRWKLVLLCHQDDFAVLSRAIALANLSDAIVAIRPDPSVGRGVCYLKGNSDLIEIDLSAQLDGLVKTLTESLAATAFDTEEQPE